MDPFEPYVKTVVGRWRSTTFMMIIHLVHRITLSPFSPMTIRCSRDHSTTACPVTMGHHPTVMSVTASHRDAPGVTSRRSRRNPSS